MHNAERLEGPRGLYFHMLFRFDNSYARLPEAFHERIRPTPIPDPHLVAFSPDAAQLLGLDPGLDPTSLLPLLSGHEVPPGADPVAMVYAGHQFGVWVPQLGDGRAILLGEVLTEAGARWDLHLKGAGKTRYSRFGDGRAVLRSSIREFLCSEAMAGLGIPTTRALGIAGSDLPVERETVETAATLLRLAPTHVRFGSFQFFASRSQHDLVTQLADHVIANHFPDWTGLPDRHLRLLQEAVERTAALMAEWAAVGFAHGVMNTDNMSILGLTLDYGPYGFLDAYDGGFICNHSDHDGRYSFGNQPGIGLWNVTRLAESMLGILNEPEAVAALDRYRPVFEDRMLHLLRRKAGLATEEEGDGDLLARLLALLQEHAVDYTRFFRALGDMEVDQPLAAASLRRFFQEAAAFDEWLGQYAERLRREGGGSIDAERKVRMNGVNPAYVLRNWLAERAIRNAVDHRDFGEIERLRVLLRTPHVEREGFAEYAESPPAWARHLSVSCSS